MHEVGAVASLIEAILAEVQAHQPCSVDAVRVQRGSTFAEDALLQAWTMLSRQTALENTSLDIEVVSHVVDCACGIERTMQADDLVGHLWICPNCAHVEEVDEHDDLTLLAVTLTPLDAPVGAGSR
jgi:Zn finger protein HypA/HybF involved in hydrogenase expression